MFDAESVPQLILATARDPAIRARPALWAAGRMLDYFAVAGVLGVMAAGGAIKACPARGCGALKRLAGIS